MALWDLLRPETKAVTPGQMAGATSRAIAPATRAGTFGAATFLPNDNVEAAVTGHYTRCLWVFRCVDAIAQAEVSIPIYSWESHDDGAMRVDGWDDIERLLNGPDKPNPYEHYWQFRYRFDTLGLLSTRGVFVHVLRDPDTDKPVALHILNTDSVTVRKHPTKYVEYYLVRSVQADGKIKEEKLQPRDVLWCKFRPHPTDPYAQVTPLVAAGLSADTDFLARMFNANWLKNDGRPGLLIGVSNKEGNEFQPEDLDELKRRFGGGPSRAGETSVIEADAISVNDMASNPKDAQYSDVLAGSKADILNAFGVSESFISWASGKTYDNASTEIEVVWENTMKWHCKAVASGFLGLIEDKRGKGDVVLAHDFSKVRFLQRGPREKAAELRAEYQAGLITADEYREATGKEPLKVPGSQVLWAPSTLLPVGRDDKTTTAAQELLANTRPKPPALGGPLPPGVDPNDPAAVEAAQQGQLPPGPPQPALPPGQPGSLPGNTGGPDMAKLRERLRQELSPADAERISNALAGAKARLRRSPEHKSARSPRPVRRRRVARDDDDIVDAEVVAEEFDDEPDETLVKEAAHEVAGTIRSWSKTMLTVVDARLDGVKARKGTRHWDPSPAEVKAGYSPEKQLREMYIVQLDRWADQLLADIRLSVRSVASRAMAEMRPELDIEASGIMRASRQVQDGTKRLSDQFERDARRKVRALQSLIRRLDRASKTLQEIKEAIAEQQTVFERWAADVAPKVANTAYNLARRYMIDNASSGVATWRTRKDERVRHGHREAEGQQPGHGRAFRISGAKLMYPGDTRAPIETWIRCRCWLAVEPRRRG